MFLDSLAGDAAWLGRYARNRWGGERAAWFPASALSLFALALVVHCMRLPTHRPPPSASLPQRGRGAAVGGHRGEAAGHTAVRGLHVRRAAGLVCKRARDAAPTRLQASVPDRVRSWLLVSRRSPLGVTCTLAPRRRVRTMLSVPYFEKALYELPEEEVTAQRILALADEVEARIEGGPAPRPLMRCSAWGESQCLEPPCHACSCSCTPVCGGKWCCRQPAGLP